MSVSLGILSWSLCDYSDQSRELSPLWLMNQNNDKKDSFIVPFFKHVVFSYSIELDQRGKFVFFLFPAYCWPVLWFYNRHLPAC